MIGKTLGDYEIKEEIGKGGMGQVYKARQISLDRDVAIKILPGNLSGVEEFRERFDLEAKVVASLMHENILQVYSKGVTDDGVHYFAMEFVDGEDLADKIKRGVTFSEREAIDIVAQVCRGLEAAWKKNIIHRDIKPSNLMVTQSGTVKIADFGLAKSLDATRKLTQTHMYMGTVTYTSPEQGEGKPLDHRTDIYSLGIVFYQLLTGSVPFTAETPSSLIYKHVYEAPPVPRTLNPNISPQTEAVVLKAIAKKREDRFQNAVEFREALESITKGQSRRETSEITAPGAVAVDYPGSPLQKGSEGSAKSRRVAPLLILVVVAIVLSGGSVLYASKYGYRALLSKVFPFAVQEERIELKTEVKVEAKTEAKTEVKSEVKKEEKKEVKAEEKKNEPVHPSSKEVAVPPPQKLSSPEPESPRLVDKNVLSPQKAASLPPPTPLKKEEEKTRHVAGFPTTPPLETKTASVSPPVALKRGPMPAVLVVTWGEQNVSDIIESVISRKLQEGSIPLSAAGEIQALAERYGRHGIPLNVLDQSPLKADVLVYVSVNTAIAPSLQFYGRTMEQYASTISIKVIDTAGKKVIDFPRPKTVHYTTLNMRDNIEEATEEMILDLSRKLTAFWKG